MADITLALSGVNSDMFQGLLLPPNTFRKTISGNTTPTSTYSGCTDAMIKELEPTTAFGLATGNTDFEISNWAADDRQFGLIRFEDIANLPANATITDVVWRFWPSYTSNEATLNLKRLLRTWNEAQATWNQASTGVNWATAGALSAGTDVSSTTTATKLWTTDLTQKDWVEFKSAQLIADVQSMLTTPASNHGWKLTAELSALNTYFQIPQRERAGSFNHRHTLEITYTVSESPVVSLTGVSRTGAVGSLSNPSQDFMLLGVNSNWNWYWDTPNYFANVMRRAADWERNSGSGAYTDVHGVLTPTVGTDEFRATVLGSDVGMPTGTYTVRWTGTGSASVSNSEAPGTWDTSGSFTYAYTAGNMMYAHYKGTGLITFEIIRPGMVTSYDSGNQWDTDYLAWFATLGVKAIRGMDWINTSKNFEEVWADRHTLSSIIWREVPYEAQIDFANRTGVNLWLNVPTRAALNQTYCTSLGTLINANLGGGRKVYIELGNEIWNTGDPWGDGTEWLRYKNNTRYEATGSGSDIINKTGHGMTSGEKINFYRKKGAPEPDSWTLRTGVEATVTVINANQYKAAATYAGGAFSATLASETYLYSRQSEQTAQQDLNANFSAAYEQMITWIATTLTTRSKYITVLSSFQNDVYTTQVRRSLLTNPANIDFMSTAPYSNGRHWAAKVNVVGGTVNPQACDTGSNSNVNWAIFPAASNPTIEDILNGNGAVQKGNIRPLDGNGIVDIYGYLDSFTGTTTVTGLTNAANYKAWFVAEHTDLKVQTVITIPFTPNGTTFSTEAVVSNADKAMLDDLEMALDLDVELHVIAANGIPLLSYEGGPHDDRDRPDTVWDSLFAYYKSTDYLLSQNRMLTQWAIKGIKQFFFYKDAAKQVQGKGHWALTQDISDVADNRYNSYRSFNGQVPIYSQKAEFSATPTTVETDPGGLPYSVKQITDSSGNNLLDSGSLTYSIVSGDVQSRFTITSAGMIQLTNKVGFNWGVSKLFTLVVCAKNAYTSYYGTVNITLGGGATGTVTLSGVSRVGNLGNITKTITKSLSNVSRSGAVGGVTAAAGSNVTLSLSGVSRSGQTGAIVPANTSVSAINVASGTSVVAASSYATPSILPIANALMLVAVSSKTTNSTVPNQPTLSGAGLTWEVVSSVVYQDVSTSRKRLTLFRALGPSPTAGALTFSFGGQNQASVQWVVDKFLGTDRTGSNGSGAIVQVATNVEMNAATLTTPATLAAFTASADSTYAAFASDSAAGYTSIDSGLRLLSSAAGAEQVVSSYSYDNVITSGISWENFSNNVTIAVEVKSYVNPDKTLTLTGVSRAGSVGILPVKGSANVTLALVGLARTGIAGAVKPGITKTASGVTRTGSTGTVTTSAGGNKSLTLSGVFRNGFVSSLNVADAGTGYKDSTLIFPELQKLSQGSAWVELFVLDATKFGGPVYRFCNHLNRSGGAVVFGGVTYNPMPIMVEGYDLNQTGTNAKPTLSLSNLSKVLLSGIVNQGDLVGAKVSRIRTLSKFLADGDTPNSSAFVGPDVMFVEQKTFHTRSMIQFQLTSVMDRNGMKLPRRQVLKDANHLGCAFPGVSRTRVS